jgi:hypothetical protein
MTTSPTRAYLEQQLAAAEDRRAEASLRLADAEEGYRDANEEVIHLETVLADLARIEGPLFHPSPRLLSDELGMTTPTDTHPRSTS